MLRMVRNERSAGGMSANYAFQPETVEALATAFREAWRCLREDPHFATLSETVMQRRLSACLLQMAADGEHDPARLADAAVERLRRRKRSAREP